LTQLGATTTITTCDTTNPTQLTNLLNTIPPTHPLTTLIHTAGVLDDATLATQTPDHLSTALGPKAYAAHLLHDLTRHLDLDAFVLISSTAATFGSPGQANYAAANAYLDALAQHRRDQGLPATSIAWGLWEHGGLANAEITGHLARRGLLPMPTEPALTALSQAIVAPGQAHRIIADIDWSTFVGLLSHTGEFVPLIQDIPEARTQRTRDVVDQQSGTALHRQLADRNPSEQQELLLRLVRTQVAAVLGHSDIDAVPPDRPFKDLGLDSLAAVETRNRLTAVTERRLPTSLIFDHPTPTKLARYVQAQLMGEGSASASAVVPSPAINADDDSIAIIGMACRFPGGVSTPEEFWDLILMERDAIADFPTNRGWDLEGIFHPDPAHKGTCYTRQGGFLYDAAEFDPAFFDISPREALSMDPQQRLLLETSWEALERAHIDPRSLQGNPVGVFTGINAQDYAIHLERSQESVEGYVLTGSSSSIASGRIAYSLGLEGPAVTVDTACSSSLVALHLACQALRSGECSMALAGGVTVMSTPTTFVEFARQRGLSTDGRCRAFSSTADGTGWGEGVGILLVERLSDARRLEHRVLAVVRGSAVNQDGASNGLTAPNGPSQQRVIRQALAAAGLTAPEIDAVEGHGTGTTLGDPIEAQALLETYGQERSADAPLWLGSVKSNIGHAQAAAGVAGVIKMVMAMREGLLPRTLHIAEPSPHVDWTAGAVRLLSEAMPWPESDRARRAGVSSFGVSGTNAHVILEQAPPVEEREPSTGTPSYPWMVSAKSEPALRAQAAQLHAYLTAHGDADLADVGHALATSRTPFEHRAVLLGPGREDFLHGLAALAAGEEHEGLVRGVASGAGKLAFLCSGQGTQRPRMGYELYQALPLFAEALDEACTHLDPHLEQPLRDVMFADPDTDTSRLLDQTLYAQPALFALQVALHRLVTEGHGVTPHFYAGHSLGEITAAHLTGILTLTDAARLVTTRARLMHTLPTTGTMTTLQAQPHEVQEHLTGLETQVSIAAVNAPGSVVISGDRDAVDTVAAKFRAMGRKTTPLNVSAAFHSPHINPILTELHNTAQTLTYHQPHTPLITTDPTGQNPTTPEYWTHQTRNTVHYTHTTHQLHTHGVTTYLELGPDTTLTTLTHHNLPHHTPHTTALLHPHQPETHTTHTALAHLHTHGHPTTWHQQHHTHHHTNLPTYPFQHHHYWLNTTPTPNTTNDTWQYREVWQPISLADADPTRLGDWLVVVSARQTDHPHVDAILSELRQRDGIRAAELVLNDADIDPVVLGRHLADAIEQHGDLSISGVLSFLAFDEEPHPEHPHIPTGTALTLTLTQTLTTHPHITAP
ncbi:type I polyketide synthase, partial [Streptomyces lonegramiae]